MSENISIPNIIKIGKYGIGLDYSGVVTLRFNILDKTACVNGIKTKESERRKGFATEIWKKAEIKLKDMGITKIFGYVNKDIIPAINFWKKVGFNLTEGFPLGRNHYKIEKELSP